MTFWTVSHLEEVTQSLLRSPPLHFHVAMYGCFTVWDLKCEQQGPRRSWGSARLGCLSADYPRAPDWHFCPLCEKRSGASGTGRMVSLLRMESRCGRKGLVFGLGRLRSWLPQRGRLLPCSASAPPDPAALPSLPAPGRRAAAASANHRFHVAGFVATGASLWTAFTGSTLDHRYPSGSASHAPRKILCQPASHGCAPLTSRVCFLVPVGAGPL